MIGCRFQEICVPVIWNDVFLKAKSIEFDDYLGCLMFAAFLSVIISLLLLTLCVLTSRDPIRRHRAQRSGRRGDVRGKRGVQ